MKKSDNERRRRWHAPKQLSNRNYDVDRAQALIALCRTGRLYEVEAWIQSGRPLNIRDRAGRTPLRVAFDTGFHSLLELLLRHHPSQDAKTDILRRALMMSHPEFVRLAVECGADANKVSFIDILRTANRTIAAFFLERGADPITGAPFAVAFHEVRAKSTRHIPGLQNVSAQILRRPSRRKPEWRFVSSVERAMSSGPT